MTRALPILYAVALLDSNGFTQSSAILHVNDVQMQVHSNGFIGESPEGSISGFTLLDGASTMYTSGLWMGGRTPANELKLAAHLSNYYFDFFPGPLTTDGSASITPEVSEAFDQVWNISAAELELHRAYFACLEDPDCSITEEFPDGYTIPTSIVNWPAHGDVSEGQDFYLAPFYDANLDGQYNPENGDYPCIAGDGALYVIYNDKLAPHTESSGGAIGAEIHMMPFAYASEDPFLAQTVFVHYTIINRSTQTLADFRIGNLADFDIGCPNDDVVGTDVGRSMVYAYNGDEADDSNCQGAIGFGEQPPAFGMVMLKGPLLDADGLDNTDDPVIPAFNGRGYDDGFIDNERHGLDQSMFYNRESTSNQTAPTLSGDYFRYLHSSWNNGMPLTYGGNGYPETPGAPLALFVYPGSSDPLGLGTMGVPQAPWSADIPTPPQDPRGLAIMGPITLEPGAEHDFLIAYVFARATTGGALASVAALQQRVDSIAAFAETIPGLMATGTVCDAVITSDIRDSAVDRASLELFPIPATTTLTVRTSQILPGTMLHIFDGRGALVAQVPSIGATTIIDVAALAPGLYTVRTTDANSLRTGRFIKE